MYLPDQWAIGFFLPVSLGEEVKSRTSISLSMAMCLIKLFTSLELEMKIRRGELKAR